MTTETWAMQQSMTTQTADGMTTKKKEEEGKEERGGQSHNCSNQKICNFVYTVSAQTMVL